VGKCCNWALTRASFIY
ncbi:unnamed protein product, partial [Allacma fusca]